MSETYSEVEDGVLKSVAGVSLVDFGKEISQELEEGEQEQTLIIHSNVKLGFTCRIDRDGEPHTTILVPSRYNRDIADPVKRGLENGFRESGRSINIRIDQY